MPDEGSGDSRFHVAIVGAGPAGAVTAILLARMGYRVALVERCRIARSHSAESLTSNAAALLERLGLAETVNRAFLHAPAATALSWGVDLEIIERAANASVLVDRSVFDASLIAEARGAGVDVLRTARASGAQRTERAWVVPLDGCARQSIEALFLVDAAGRASYLRRRGSKRGVPTTALHAEFAIATRAFSEMRLEALPAAWVWGVPSGSDRVLAIAFVEQAAVSGRTALARREVYGAVLREARLFAQCAAGTPLSPVVASDATFLADADPIDERSLKVGDAALAFDPLTSQGLQQALRSAMHASACIRTLLSGAGYASAALAFYRDVHERSRRDHERNCAAHYARVTRYATEPFWRARSSAVVPAAVRTTRPPRFGADELFRLSPAARIRDVAALDHGIVTWVPGLTHPGFEAALAFLSGRPAGRLAQALFEPATLEVLAARWSTEVAPREAATILRWLVEQGALEPVRGRSFPEGDPPRSHPVTYDRMQIAFASPAEP